MANSLSASFPDYWSRRMQLKLKKDKVYRMISSFEEQSNMKDGDVVNRPYRSALTVNSLGSEGSYTRQDVTDTIEYLTINVKPEVSIYVQDVDEIMSHYKTANLYADDAADVIGDKLDGDVLGEYDNAASVVANYEITASGTAGDGIGFTLTTSNIIKAFGKAAEKLTALNVPLSNRWAVISPQFYNVLWEFIAGKESLLGDNSGQNGNIGSYNGFKLFINNNVASSYRLEVGSTATDADTVVINGVTFTFETSTLDAAGKVKSETSAAVCIDNLVAAINNSESLAASTLGTAYYNITAANRAKLSGIVATDGTTYMTIKVEGKSYIAVSETLSAPADIWTTTKQLQHNLFGQGNPIDMVMHKDINLRMKDRDGYLGKDFVTWALYGLKTFNEGTKKLVDVAVRTDAF
jgi:hypothetical protein